VTRSPTASGGLPRRGLVILITLAAVAGLGWGVRWLNDVARRGIATRDRYTVRFLDIQCDPPAGYQRVSFLSEVQFHSKFPATIQSVDPDLGPNLAAAFGAHPWVLRVNDVLVEPDGAVRVKLEYRRPALAVKIKGTKDQFRVADATGVLLPLGADSTGLPQLITGALSPTTPSGKPWPDQAVKRAVELVEAHHPASIEETDRGWRLTLHDGRMLMVH
jgi:hypothetical protein